MDGTEIKVGVTTLAELEQAGFAVAKDKHFKEGLDGEEMPGRTYDVGVFLGKDNIVYANVECLNDKKDPISYMESTIYNISIAYEPSTDPYDVEHYHENILIDGTSLKGMSVEEVDALLVSKSKDHSEAKYPDGLIYSKSYTIGKNYYTVQFNEETQKVYLVEIEIFKANF